MNRLLLTALMICTLSWASECFAQSPDKCFAFLRQGDVIVSCAGTSSQITYLANIENFAISEEKSTIGYITSRILSRTATGATALYTATLIGLKSGDARRIDGITRLIATCGTILENQIGVRSNRRDLLAGSDIAVPYVRFRCSADRKKIAGITSDGARRGDRSDLYQGVPPGRKIAASSDVYIHYFNMSPDGSKIAWFNEQKPLCEFAAPGPPSCQISPSLLTDPVSVNDAGGILVATGTGEDCFYRNESYFSDQPFPGGPRNANGECLGIGYWRPGMQSFQIVEPLGRNPQWISPDTAELLVAWSRRVPR